MLGWRVLGFRKSLKNAASHSSPSQVAQDVSSNYEPCASTVSLPAQCSPHICVGSVALVVSVSSSVQGTECLWVDQCSVTRLSSALGMLAGSPTGRVSSECPSARPDGLMKDSECVAQPPYSSQYA